MKSGYWLLAHGSYKIKMYKKASKFKQFIVTCTSTLVKNVRNLMLEKKTVSAIEKLYIPKTYSRTVKSNIKI